MGARGLGHFCVEGASCHSGVAQLEVLQGKFGFPLPSSLPLFATTDGEVCIKAAIIQCLEATLSAFGVSTVAETSLRLSGGHSFRVAGAQRLATFGVEIAKIIQGHGPVGWQHRVTAREGSATREPLVGARCVGGAQGPRTIRQLLKAEFAALAEQVSAQAVGTTSAHGRLQRETDEGLEKLQRQCAPVAEKRTISRCGAGRHKVHLAMVVSEGAVPVDWRTCFSLWAYTRHSDVAAFPEDTLCEKCFGRRQLSSSSRTRDLWCGIRGGFVV